MSARRKAFCSFSVLLLVLVLAASAAWARPVRHRLASGLTVITSENHEAPVVCFQVWVRAGSAFERPGEYGITHLIEHMIFKGSPKNPHGIMARRIEALGGEVNAYTTYDHTNYHVTAASRYAPQVLGLLADAVVNASFDPDELKKEKEVVIEEIRMNLDNPRRRLAWRVFKEAFGPDHPYGRPVIGSVASVRAITRKDILNYRARWYRAPNVVVVAVGDFDTNKILPLIEKDFAGLPTGPSPAFKIPPVTQPKGPRLVVMREKVKQAAISLAWLIPGLPSEETYPLDMAATVLGEGETSRLWSRLKEKKGLVDSISAGAYTPRGVGAFLVQARTAPAKLARAWRPMLRQVMDLARRPPSAAELKKANTNLTAEFVRERQTMQGQASTLGYFELLRGGFEKALVYLERFRGLSAGQVARAARRYFTPARLSVVIQAPPGAKLPDRKALAAYLDKLSAKLGPPPSGQPKPLVKVLKNGLTLIVQPRRAVPVVEYALVAPGGLAAEPPDQKGLYSLWARTLTRGSKHYTYQKLAARLEGMAGSLDAFSGKTTCGLSGSFLARDWARGLKLLAEVWLDPTFPPEQIARAKAEQAAALRAQQDSPVSRAFLAFRKLIYGKHPYARNPLGTLESLKRLGRKELLAAHRRSRGPGGVVLAVVGDVSAPAVLKKVERLLGGIQGRAVKPQVPPLPPLAKPRIKAITDPKAKQTQIVLGFLVPGAGSPDRHAFQVLEAVLGGMGGRLFSDLRDRLSLAYAVQPFYADYPACGVFGVYMGVGPGKEKAALEGLARHLKRLRAEPPSQEEMQRAKNYLLGSLAVGLQSYGSQAMTMAVDQYLGRGWDYYRKQPADLEAVRAARILELARRYLKPGSRAELTLGPGK